MPFSQRVSLVLCHIFCRSRWVEAQNLSNGTNGTGLCTSKPGEYDQCCFRIQKEAAASCREFENWGIEPTACKDWTASAVAECDRFCGDCSLISRQLFGKCYFFLQNLGVFENIPAIMKVCEAYRMDFEHRRCKAACGALTSGKTLEEGKQIELATCTSPEWAACNAKCGNYGQCQCMKMRGKFGEPDNCEGETYLTGAIPGRSGLQYDCRLIPKECTSHRIDTGWWNTTCGRYRYCPVDLCIVKNVSCPLLQFCWAAGKCNSLTGTCSYAFKPDATPCNDGFHYTFNDMCKAGECVGEVDKCVKENIICNSVNPCLELPGKCHPKTGGCTFTPLPDGTPCQDDRPYVQNRTCIGGLCRGQRVDLCENITCVAKSPCHVKGRCNEATGLCSNPKMLEGVPCDDGDPGTHRDRCVDGNCVGDRYKDPKFELLGEGSCVDSSHQKLARYWGDEQEFNGCLQQCGNDPACSGFSYGYYTCSIHGSRQRAPDVRYWGKLWVFEAGSQGGVADAKVLHPQDAKHDCYRKGTISTRRKKDFNLWMLVIVMLFCLFGPCTILLSPHAFERWYKRMQKSGVKFQFCRCRRAAAVVPAPPATKLPEQQNIAPPDSQPPPLDQDGPPKDVKRQSTRSSSISLEEQGIAPPPPDSQPPALPDAQPPALPQEVEVKSEPVKRQEMEELLKAKQTSKEPLALD